MKIMSNKRFTERMLAARERAYELAFTEFNACDKVIVGPSVIRDCEISEKLVILGTGSLISGNTFTSGGTKLSVA